MQKVFEIPLELNSDKINNRDIICSTKYSDTYVFQIQLFNDGTPYEISEGVQVLISCTLPDGTVNNGVCSITDTELGIVRYDLPNELYSTPGKVSCRVTIENEEGTLTWQIFTFIVVIPVDLKYMGTPESYMNWTREINEHYITLDTKIDDLIQRVASIESVILDLENLISEDPGNIIKMGSDNKLFGSNG